MAELKDQPRKKTPVERTYNRLKDDMDGLLVTLFNLGDDDKLIPIISEIY